MLPQVVAGTDKIGPNQRVDHQHTLDEVADYRCPWASPDRDRHDRLTIWSSPQCAANPEAAGWRTKDRRVEPKRPGSIRQRSRGLCELNCT